MKTYGFIAQRPRTYFPLPAAFLGLSEELFAAELAGVVVRELSEDEWGRVTVDVSLPRASDQEALEEIVSLLRQQGFVVVRATVSEWVNEIIERAVLGALAGGTAGATTKNVLAAGVASVLGALIVGATGAEVQTLNAEYEASRDLRGAWSLCEVPRDRDGRGLEPNPGIA